MTIPITNTHWKTANLLETFFGSESHHHHCRSFCPSASHIRHWGGEGAECGHSPIQTVALLEACQVYVETISSFCARGSEFSLSTRERESADLLSHILGLRVRKSQKKFRFYSAQYSWTTWAQHNNKKPSSLQNWHSTTFHKASKQWLWEWYKGILLIECDQNRSLTWPTGILCLLDKISKDLW